MFTIVESAAASGIPVPVLRNWIMVGVVTPAHAGWQGAGAGHRFSLPQVLGLAVAEELRRHPRGCTPAYVGTVVEAFAGADEGKLRKEFAAGRTHLLTLVPWEARDGSGRKGVHLILGKPAYDDQVDVRAVYERVRHTLGAEGPKPERPGKVLVVNAKRGG